MWPNIQGAPSATYKFDLNIICIFNNIIYIIRYLWLNFYIMIDKVPITRKISLELHVFILYNTTVSVIKTKKSYERINHMIGMKSNYLSLCLCLNYYWRVFSWLSVFQYYFNFWNCKTDISISGHQSSPSIAPFSFFFWKSVVITEHSSSNNSQNDKVCFSSIIGYVYYLFYNTRLNSWQDNCWYLSTRNISTTQL